MWSSHWLIAFAYWTFLPIFKMVSLFDHYLFFRAVLCTEQLQCPTSFPGSLVSASILNDNGGREERPWERGCAMSCRNVFSLFFFFNFWQSDHFAKAISHLLGGRFSQCLEWSHFSKISCFSSRFRTYQLECLQETFLACCFAFLIFHLKCRFCTG